MAFKFIPESELKLLSCISPTKTLATTRCGRDCVKVVAVQDGRAARDQQGTRQQFCLHHAQWIKLCMTPDALVKQAQFSYKAPA